jgi:UDP-glucose 4-epimerase
LIEQRVLNTIINLGSGEGHSLLGVVDTVKVVTGNPLELVFRPSRRADVPRLVLDIGRLRDLGLHYTRSLEDGIRAYVDLLASSDGL